jgi:hypothetical protein
MVLYIEKFKINILNYYFGHSHVTKLNLSERSLSFKINQNHSGTLNIDTFASFLFNFNDLNALILKDNEL